MARTTVASICRICPNTCAIHVDVDDGVVARVTGDRSNPVSQGYTCVKGRAQPAMLSHPDRLLHSLKRGADGSYGRISPELAMDEIAESLAVLVERYGPRCIAGYLGTYVITSPLTGAFHDSFLRAVGTPMRFTSSTIDKPGKPIAKALHGAWMAPQQGYVDPDVAMLVGLNPLVSYQGFPLGNPWQVARSAATKGHEADRDRPPLHRGGASCVPAPADSTGDRCRGARLLVARDHRRAPPGR